MRKKALFDREQVLKLDQPGGRCLQTAARGVKLNVPVRVVVDKNEPRRPASEQENGAWLLVGGGQPLLKGVLRRDPESETPGLIFAPGRSSSSALSLATVPLRRKTVEQKNDPDLDPFHDSEVDIYDLYNAVNGVVLNGLLDINQLDEYTPAEAEELNVPRLREIWHHTASGCPRCASIISTLNSIRGSLSADDEESLDGQTRELDIDAIDSIS